MITKQTYGRTAAVPGRWNPNSTMMITAVIGRRALPAMAETIP